MLAVQRHWKSCLHEAGHCLFSLSTGIVPQVVNVEPHGDGACHSETSQMRPEDRCVMAMVGAVATEILGDSPGHCGAFMSIADQAIYREAADELQGNAVRIGRAMHETADRFVRDHAEGIKQVAAALADKRKMGPNDLAKVVHQEPSLFPFRKLIAKPKPPKLTIAAHRQTPDDSRMPAGRREFLQKNPHMRATIEGMARKGLIQRSYGG